ncbi:MAG: flippase-like domain-containing protein [Fimbriimonadaceae bacterium]|nr:flippase-like domain-containing protein [Alphaproteobacteria bacterium]
MTLRSGVLLTLKFGVGFALLGYLFQRIDLTKAVLAVLAMHPGYLAIGVMAFFAALLVNSRKLKLLLPELSVMRLFAFTMIGLYYGMILPGQIAGDAVKAVKMSGGRDLARFASATVFDKVTGIAALLVFTLAALVVEYNQFHPWLAGLLSFALLLILAAIILPALSGFNRLTRLLDVRGQSSGSFVRSILLSFTRFAEVWQLYSRQRLTVALSLLFGILFQSISVSVAWLFGLGLGIEVSYAAWAVVIGVMSIVVLLPITIAGLGLREATIVGMLIGLGVSEAQGLACSLVMLSLYLIAALVGAIFDFKLARSSERRDV